MTHQPTSAPTLLKPVLLIAAIFTVVYKLTSFGTTAPATTSTKTMSGHFTFEKFDAPGSASTTMYKAMDKTGNIVPYFRGMELLAAEMEDGALFRSQLLRTLRESPNKAFFYEMPPVTRSTASEEAFEFILNRAKALENVGPEAGVFAQHFTNCISEGSDVAKFFNLGRDAFLISPCPNEGADSERSFAHFASFVRDKGASAQADRFLRATGEAVLERVGSQPLWVSTSGAGVYWLHLRLDSDPKYYTYAPYRNAKGKFK